MPSTAWILLGHGSHISPNTAGMVWEQVDCLREKGVADEITAAFWKEQPSFHQVLHSVAATDITLLPLFTADGYFTQTVIPAEMGLAGQLTQHNGRVIRYAPSLANHPYISQVLHQRTTQALQDYALPASKTAVAIIGHGTRRNPESRTATEKQAALLREAQLVAEVVAAYLDDEPSIPDIYTLTQQPNLIVIPYFLALGSHTTQDVPQALGLAEGQTVASLNGRQVYYTLPVGISDGLTDILVGLARQADAPFKTLANPSAWGSFPQVGVNEPLAQVEQSGGLAIGELWLTPQRVCHQADVGHDDLQELKHPAELRRYVREQPFRPLATARGLRRGWQVSDSTRLAAVVETVYPGILANWHHSKVQTLTAVAARQTGMYARLGDLSLEKCAEVIEEVCSGCILKPAWMPQPLPSEAIPCPEACNWWMSYALEKSHA